MRVARLMYYGEYPQVGEVAELTIIDSYDVIVRIGSASLRRIDLHILADCAVEVF